MYYCLFNSLRKIKYSHLLIKSFKRKAFDQNKFIKRYPHTIQMPITYKCNFDCIMCGMHQLIGKHEFDTDELSMILSDSLFKKVRNIGINGGEPFLRNDLPELIGVMKSRLPKLKNLYFISNGFYTEKILFSLKEIKHKYTDLNLNLSISIDAVGKLQDYHRGALNAFVNAEKTIEKIMNSKSEYVDHLNVICTVTKKNVYNLPEVEIWAESVGVSVDYNIATVNSRIKNEDRVDDFDVFTNKKARLVCSEFFYKKYIETGREKYFALYLYLLHGKRYSLCPCQKLEWITLMPDCQLGFCATHSKEIGCSLEEEPNKIVDNNLSYLDEIKNNYCDGCSHYTYQLNDIGLRLLYKDKTREL